MQLVEHEEPQLRRVGHQLAVERASQYELEHHVVGEQNIRRICAGTRKLDLLMLTVRRTPLPIAGLAVSAHGGWLENEQKGLFGLGVSALGDAVQMNVVVEGAPVRLRSVALRMEAL